MAAGCLDAKIEYRDGIQYRLDERGAPHPQWLGVGTVGANRQIRIGGPCYAPPTVGAGFRCTVTVNKQASRSLLKSMSGQAARARLIPEPSPR